MDSLREFLEARWAERRGLPITEALVEFGVPVGKDDPNSIDWVGAERVRDRETRWEEREQPEEDFHGALWMDGLVAGLAFASRPR